MNGRPVKFLTLKESDFLGVLRGTLRLEPPLPADCRLEAVRIPEGSDRAGPPTDDPWVLAKLRSADFPEVPDGHPIPSLDCKAVPADVPAPVVVHAPVRFREFL